MSEPKPQPSDQAEAAPPGAPQVPAEGEPAQPAQEALNGESAAENSDSSADTPKAEETHEEAKATASNEEVAPLLHKGNPLRRLRGGATAGAGAFLAFVLMAHNRQLWFGVPLGI